MESRHKESVPNLPGICPTAVLTLREMRDLWMWKIIMVRTPEMPKSSVLPERYLRHLGVYRLLFLAATQFHYTTLHNPSALDFFSSTICFKIVKFYLIFAGEGLSTDPVDENPTTSTYTHPPLLELCASFISFTRSSIFMIAFPTPNPKLSNLHMYLSNPAA